MALYQEIENLVKSICADVCKLVALALLLGFYCVLFMFSAAAAAAKSLQSCPTLCDPRDSAHQASLSLGFSRQEHWSGLPFPSPIRESEK